MTSPPHSQPGSVSALRKSHDAMLKFLEKRITESDKWPGKSPNVQKAYNEAKRLVAKAHAARSTP